MNFLECPKFKADPNRGYNCTNGFFSNSVCEFNCKENYVMLVSRALFFDVTYC